MQTLAMSLVIAREDGRLKRGRGNADARLGLHRRPDRQLDRPLAADVHDRRRDRTILYGVSIPWSHLPELLVILAIGAASFCCLGIALTAAIPSQDAAAPIVNALLLPLYFLSGVFIPDGELPNGVIHFADYFPIRHFFEAFFDVYVERTGDPMAPPRRGRRLGRRRPPARDPLLPLDPAHAAELHCAGRRCPRRIERARHL